MVSPIAPGDTTQWEVTSWLWQQGQFLPPTQQLVLAYLAGNAFYQRENPEGAEVGQVLRQASYVDSITAGTGLKRDAIRTALTALQMAGYIQRGTREDPNLYGQQPHLIYVLWEAEGLRQGLRDGSRRLPDELLSVPSRPAPKKPPAPVLSIIKEYDENAH